MVTMLYPKKMFDFPQKSYGVSHLKSVSIWGLFRLASFLSADIIFNLLTFSFIHCRTLLSLLVADAFQLGFPWSDELVSFAAKGVFSHLLSYSVEAVKLSLFCLTADILLFDLMSLSVVELPLFLLNGKIFFKIDTATHC